MVGRTNPKMKEIYKVVHEAQQPIAGHVLQVLEALGQAAGALCGQQHQVEQVGFVLQAVFDSDTRHTLRFR
jgi:3-hydroxymyristoyl/3-hydroxydecanoyl-(acyl carrier protein) dehydratase